VNCCGLLYTYALTMSWIAAGHERSRMRFTASGLHADERLSKSDRLFYSSLIDPINDVLQLRLFFSVEW